MGELADDAVLRWAAAAVDAVAVVEVVNLHEDPGRGSGSFRLRMNRGDTTTDLVLKIAVPGSISDGIVSTNARTPQLAATHDLAAPRLVASDLEGQASGPVATLETLLSGSSALPPTVSVARLEEAGAAIARSTRWPSHPKMICRTGLGRSPWMTSPATADKAGCRPQRCCGALTR